MPAMRGSLRLVGIVVVAAASLAAHQASSARDAYDRAIALEAKGDHAGGLALLWEAAALAPKDPEIQNGLGEALERLGALDAAIEAFRRALDARPDFRKASDNLILTLVKAGRGEEAISRAASLVAAKPDDPQRQFTLGLAQAEQDVDAAIRTFRRVLELDSRHALARYNLALVLKRADRMADAADELRRAIAIEPRAEAYYSLGVIHWHQGNLDGAVDALKLAVSADPRSADAHQTLGAVLKDRKDWSGAAASLRRAIALRPELPGARYTLAQVLRASGDAEGARKEEEEAERLRRRAQQEHEALVWTTVGIEKLEGGKPLEALDQFRRAISAYEPYAPAHYQLGRAFRQLGDTVSASAAFDRARRLNPNLVPPPEPPKK
jgi:tetratricopeptide (TPR) repeat protein